jgi:hypothetical protein
MIPGGTRLFPKHCFASHCCHFYFHHEAEPGRWETALALESVMLQDFCLEATHDIHHIGLGNIDLSFDLGCDFKTQSRSCYLNFIRLVPIDRTVYDTASNVSSYRRRGTVHEATSVVHSLTSTLSG